jgi:hypothetical protein
MRRGPVEFRAHSVFRVEVVQVLVTGTLPDPHLTASGGQPVRAFHAMHVAILQHGQDAIPGVTQSQDELTAPAHLLAGIHGLAYPLGGGTPAADGPADPRVRVVEGRRDLIRSRTVSSIRVHGGSMVGCLVRRIASDRWMRTPGIFARVGVLDRGTVMMMSELGSSVRPCRSAAV